MTDFPDNMLCIRLASTYDIVTTGLPSGGGVVTSVNCVYYKQQLYTTTSSLLQHSSNLLDRVSDLHALSVANAGDSVLIGIQNYLIAHISYPIGFLGSLNVFLVF